MLNALDSFSFIYRIALETFLFTLSHFGCESFSFFAFISIIGLLYTSSLISHTRENENGNIHSHLYFCCIFTISFTFIIITYFHPLAQFVHQLMEFILPNYSSFSYLHLL